MQFTVELWANEKLGVEVDGNVAAIDGKVIPQEMLEHAIRFGFRQLIRDAGAISKEAALKPDADSVRNELARKKVAALVAGTLREGAGGQRLDPVQREVQAIAIGKVRAACHSQGIAATEAKIKALADRLVERDLDKLVKEAEANLAKRGKDIDLDALLKDVA